MRRALRITGWALLLAGCAFFVARAMVELVVIQWNDPAAYHHDWGGPSLLGVLAVHCTPGILAALLLVRLWRRRRTTAEL